MLFYVAAKIIGGQSVPRRADHRTRPREKGSPKESPKARQKKGRKEVRAQARRARIPIPPKEKGWARLK